MKKNIIIVLSLVALVGGTFFTGCKTELWKIYRTAVEKSSLKKSLELWKHLKEMEEF